MTDDAPMQNSIDIKAPTPDPPTKQEQPAESFRTQPAIDSPAPPLMNIHADIDMVDVAVRIKFNVAKYGNTEILIFPPALTGSSAVGSYTDSTKNSHPDQKYQW